MIQKLKNLSQYAAIAAPIYAVDLTIQPQGNKFDALKNLTIGNMISGAISLVLLVVALIFFFTLIIGGLKWVMSNGDQKAVESARSQITNALIGLAIVFAAFAIMRLVGTVFGIDLLGTFSIPTFAP